MPTIAFSNGFMAGSSGTLMGRVISYGSTGVGLLPGGGAGAYSYAPAVILSLMKGTVPSNFSTLTSWASRSADVLVSWAIRNDSRYNTTYPAVNNFSPSASTVNLNPNTLETTYVTAGAAPAAGVSGTATWFWWVTRDWYPYGSFVGEGGQYRDNIYQQIIGTVGTIGSGSDLELPSTTITSGQLLRVVNLRLQLPSTYNY